MEFENIRELIKEIDNSNIDEFTYKQGSTVIKIKKNQETMNLNNKETSTPMAISPVAPLEKVETPVVKDVQLVQEKVVQDENLHKITSPMVGTFYSSPTPDAKEYVSSGSKVNEESVVCIVEAMKLFNEIQAEVKGEIVEVLAQNGQLVEYGQPLFLVRAN